MKLRCRTLGAFGLGLALWSACDAADPTDAGAPLGSKVDVAEARRLDSSNQESERFEGLRARAEAAFEEAAKTPQRSETRVGPQPWPQDLPSKWPRPTSGRVVADSRRAGGERLLLIDVPGGADEALAAYRRALRAEHFEVDEIAAAGSRSSLRARRGPDEATLRFFDRDRRTRVEILFLATDVASDS